MATQLPFVTPARVVLLVPLLYVLYKLLRFGNRDKRLPPGPPTVPILGNAHMIPPGGLHYKLKEWGDLYGKIYSLKIGADTMIVLNDRQAIHEMIDKRSAITSDRALDENSDIALGLENIAFIHSTPMWRAQRKIASQNLGPPALRLTAHIQEAEICQMMNDLLVTPEDFEHHVKRTTSSSTSITVWGYRAKTFDNFWCKPVYEGMHLISTSLEPGSHLPVNQFPILKLIPDRWVSSKELSKRCFETTSAHWLKAVQRVQDRIKDGDIRESVADRVIREEVKLDVPHSPRQLANFLGALHQGAADTTAGMILSHILYLAKHPWVQKKAQSELDRVCGVKRLPKWDDFDQLPYINCIIKEGMRISPVVPTGIPHRLKQDDWYNGMLLPKDSLLFFAPHALHRNASDPLYTDPETYNPDRYLQHTKLASEYASSGDYANRDHYAYGGGRRICVGIHLAERTQWRFVAGLLWGFEILPGVDERGEEVGLEVRYKKGLLSEPEAFGVRFVPRSGGHVEVLRRELGEVEGFLRGYE
ncbi:cytochrome P450 oxidoreductase-like protein [Polyplosphaeria fusca]|uniref:Cytochrome P450 oxidoreductase-like protein n=1 Tax=Polyplosphaeria fusca TaxID=682080 RepID=A0A9P4UX41_9PLEO|nr:cytochrome P450 oxidoreductase-like protein [Polyplosphaeria fusca]